MIAFVFDPVSGRGADVWRRCLEGLSGGGHLHAECRRFKFPAVWPNELAQGLHLLVSGLMVSIYDRPLNCGGMTTAALRRLVVHQRPVAST